MADSINDGRTASEIPPFGKAYASAHKAYGLVSALLIAWELIGVELNAAPVENIKITLKSPQAAPYVLIVLIVYFGFRMTIEWYQSDTRRRQLRASKIDFRVAHAIAAVSLLLYSYQTMSNIQLVNILPARGVLAFVVGMVTSQVCIFNIVSGVRSRRRQRRASVVLGLYFFAFIAGSVWAFRKSPDSLGLGVVIWFFVGLIFGMMTMLFVFDVLEQVYRTKNKVMGQQKEGQS